MSLDYRACKESEAVQKKADAAYYAKAKEADGLAAMAKAYGDMSAVLGGSQGLLQYMLIQDNAYEKLALANAQAISGLQPKITTWTTGGEGSSNDGTSALRNIMQNLPPLLSTINEQTGIAPPSWMAQMPGQQALEKSGNSGDGKAKVNGNYGKK